MKGYWVEILSFREHYTSVTLGLGKIEASIVGWERQASDVDVLAGVGW